ncbi:MAG: hypothetical protein IPN42_12875 [Methylococcaceae bacterium]|nr:hypothetical protein [Methylococcaceae bacterium]
MVEFFTAQNLSDIGSWSSIVGLLITVFTFLMLFGIRKKFLFRSSVDDHLEKLTDISSQISSLLISFKDNQKDIEELFALADVELRAMQRGADGDLLSYIKRSSEIIKKYTSKIFFWIEKNEDSAREIKRACQ